jgi:hypothetical protein
MMTRYRDVCQAVVQGFSGLPKSYANHSSFFFWVFTNCSSDVL